MNEDYSTKQHTAKERYEKLKEKREQYLDRARECSELTIPALIPEDGFHYTSELYTPFQSVGARGVNNLASKLLLLLLPPNSPFFRLSVSGKAKEQLDEQREMQATVEKSLQRIEKNVQNKIEELALRTSAFEAIKHLIVGGNVLTYLPKDGHMKVFPLTQYVCTRDSEGELLEVVIKESITPLSLDVEVRAQVISDPDYKEDEEVELYTHIYKLDNDKYYICQEVHGIKIPGSIGTFAKDAMPYMCLRMVRVDGEDYGRGYVEEFLGDLKSLEGLSQSLVESAAASSKVVFMIRPNSVTKKRDLALTRNGDIITGSRDDVSVLQTEKQYDLRVVQESIRALEERMSFAFLLHTAIQRDAERVTAQEIRYMAEQLETSMGGIYSLLSIEFQMPLVKILMKRMSQTKEIPSLPKGTVKPTIITGIEALGRGNDLQKLREFIAEFVQLAQVNPQVMQTLNPGDLIKRIATGLGIETEGLIKSQEELQQEMMAQQDQMMQEQLMNATTDAAAKSVPGIANNVTKGMMNGRPSGN